MLNLQELERKLDVALAAETPESLRAWLGNQRTPDNDQEDVPIPTTKPELETASILS